MTTPHSFSNQELFILSKQSGILFCRYYMGTRMLENLYSNPELHFGIAAMQEDAPDSVVRRGVVSEDTTAAYFLLYEKMHHGLPGGSTNVKLRVQSGEFRWHHVDYSLVFDDNGKPIYALISFFDNTEQRETELAAEKWHASLSAWLTEALVYAELNLTKNTVDRFEMPRRDTHEKPVVHSLEDAISHGMQGELAPEVYQEYLAFFRPHRLLRLFSEGVQEDHFDYLATTEDGEELLLRAAVGMARYPHSKDVMATISFSRLTDQQKDLEQLSHMAFHDALTGLLNRDGIDQHTEEALASYNPQCATALFMIDLDDFKQINDHLGHQVGDLVLKRVGDALCNSFHQTDIVGRLGGDEFIVLLTGAFDITFLERKAYELLAAIKLHPANESDIPISISIGIAFAQARTTFDRLYRTADIALYTAKKAGKRRFHLINADTNSEQAYSGEAQYDLVPLQDLLEFADEASLEKNRTPFETLVQNMPGSVIVVTLTEGRVQFTYCNNWITSYSGFTMQEIETMQEVNSLAFIHPDDQHIITQAIHQLQNGADSINITYRIQHKNGSFKYSMFQALRSERTHNTSVFYGIQTDVDKLIRAKHELELSQRKLDALVHAIPGGIAVFELGDSVQVTHHGSWVYEFSGYTPDEIVALRHGTAFNSILLEDSHTMQNALQAVRDGDDTLNITVGLKCKNGEAKPIHIRGSVIERTPELITLYLVFIEAE